MRVVLIAFHHRSVRHHVRAMVMLRMTMPCVVMLMLVLVL
jgi:hypothetical protein